jgi:thioredoxin 2
MSGNPLIVRCRACRTLNRIPEGKLDSHPVCGQCKTILEVPHAPINVTTTSYDQQVRDWPEVLVAEFWAKWCGYCRSMEPYINSLALKRTGRLKIIRVDVDSEPVLARRFMIKATPTFILYRNGRQLGRIDGAPKQQNELEYWIDHTLLQQYSHSG